MNPLTVIAKVEGTLFVDSFGRPYFDTCADTSEHLTSATPLDQERPSCRVYLEDLLRPLIGATSLTGFVLTVMPSDTEMDKAPSAQVLRAQGKSLNLLDDENLVEEKHRPSSPSILAQISLKEEEILDEVNLLNDILFERLSQISDEDDRKRTRLKQIIAVGSLHTTLMNSIAEPKAREVLARVAADFGMSLGSEEIHEVQKSKIVS